MALAHRDVAGVLKRHNYVEIKKIGEGSFGRALLVATSDGNRLVCKMVDVSQASPKETHDAVKESRLLAHFKHPYIVRYRESFTDSGWLCILMEDYCEGGDLTKQIEAARRARRTIAEDQILQWMTQALLALKGDGGYTRQARAAPRFEGCQLVPLEERKPEAGRFRHREGAFVHSSMCKDSDRNSILPQSRGVPREAVHVALRHLGHGVHPLRAVYPQGAIRRPKHFDARAEDLPRASGFLFLRIPNTFSDFTRELCSQMLSRSPTSRPTAEEVLQRPRIQGFVKQMLEKAQAQQESTGHSGRLRPRRPGTAAQQRQPVSARQACGGCPAGSGDAGLAPAVPPLLARGPFAEQPAAFAPEVPPYGRGQPPRAVGPFAEQAGTYQKGALVEYHSSTHKEWLPAVVLNRDQDRGPGCDRPEAKHLDPGRDTGADAPAAEDAAGGSKASTEPVPQRGPSRTDAGPPVRPVQPVSQPPGLPAAAAREPRAHAGPRLHARPRRRRGEGRRSAAGASACG
ncbi:unnamed protein product, partial [Prorocentrum cordatum]